MGKGVVLYYGSGCGTMGKGVTLWVRVWYYG